MVENCFIKIGGIWVIAFHPLMQIHSL